MLTPGQFETLGRAMNKKSVDMQELQTVFQSSDPQFRTGLENTLYLLKFTDKNDAV